MATIIPATTFPQHGVAQTTWTGFAALNDVGRAETLERYPTKSVTVLGTFTGSLTILIQGSDDNATWRTLLMETSAGDAAASFTAAGGGQLVDNPQYIRPFASVGTGGASATVILSSKTFGN